MAKMSRKSKYFIIDPRPPLMSKRIMRKFFKAVTQHPFPEIALRTEMNDRVFVQLTDGQGMSEEAANDALRTMDESN